jgi:hypothetical protein
MGYKLLGYVVWRAGRWYVRRQMRARLTGRKAIAFAGLAALAIGGALAAQRAPGG